MKLDVNDLHVGYDTARVLNGVSISVDTGESVALLGRNGMGKTSLVRAICGLHPPTVTRGSVMVDGVSVRGEPSFKISRRGVALVPQGRRVFGSLTVDENLTVIARKHAKDDSAPVTGQHWSTERVYEFFPRLRERTKEFARSLSGGEQQMLAIGRALMTNPSLLIMDEPSEGLAPSVLDVIQDRLDGLRATGLSTLIAEQNLDLALDLADRVYIIGAEGTVAWSGTPGDLRAHDDVLDAHLGV